jgi:hypothetical protein
MDQNNQTDPSGQNATTAASSTPAPSPTTDIASEARQAALEAVKEVTAQTQQQLEALRAENDSLKQTHSALSNALNPKQEPQVSPLAVDILRHPEHAFAQFGANIAERTRKEVLDEVRAERAAEYEKAQAIKQVLGDRKDIASDPEAQKLISFYYNEEGSGSEVEKLSKAKQKYDNFLKKKGYDPEKELQEAASISASGSSGEATISSSAAMGTVGELSERKTAWAKKWGRTL